GTGDGWRESSRTSPVLTYQKGTDASWDPPASMLPSGDHARARIDDFQANWLTGPAASGRKKVMPPYPAATNSLPRVDQAIAEIVLNESVYAFARLPSGFHWRSFFPAAETR